MYWKVALWMALYLAVVALPLLVAFLPPRPPGRSLVTEFGVALGFVGLSLMVLQFVLIARFRRALPPFAADTIWQFHRQMGVVGLGLVLAHPILQTVADSGTLAYLDPTVDWMRAGALWTATLMLVFVVCASLWREQIGLSYEWWRISHGAAATVVLLVGLAHVIQVGHYVSTVWHQAFFGTLVLGAIGFLGYVRVGKPWLMRRRPYRVVEVREEPGDVWTLSMTPDGHAGLRFEAGQYGWITLADSPFTLQQHPYSFSSSAEHPERLEFTIKALGDFSGSIGERGDGARAYIEGPYGSFTFTDPSARGAVFIAGGIGVTPFMSMLRTMRDRNDSRHFMLFYGNERIEDIVFREEIGRLQQVLNLEVHHVLEHPPADWDGLDGLLSTEMLEAHLPQAGASDYHYYICGPEPMIDVAEPTLIDRGLPLSRIYAERFSIV